VFFPFTHGEVPWIRYVNLILITGIIFFTWQLLNRLNEESQITGSLNYLFIPVTFVCCSLALTELPAMFFLLLTILLLMKANRQIKPVFIIPWLVAAACCMSLAILGRQPYLLLLPILVMLSVYLPAQPFRWRFSVLFAALSLAIPLYVFNIWQGWIPKGMTDYVDDGYSVKNAIIAFGLCGAIFLLLAPQWYRILIPYWKPILVSGLLLVFFNYFFIGSAVLPFRGVLMKLDQSIQDIIGRIAGGLLICGGLIFLLSLLLQLRRHGKDFWFLFSGLCMMGILFSCLKVTHMFSARYVYQAAPFIVFLVNRYRLYNVYSLITSILCVVMGLTAMWFTFH
jgi:hypothetical protein